MKYAAHVVYATFACLLVSVCQSQDTRSRDAKLEYLDYAVHNTGDAQRGELIFQKSKTALCSNCHQLVGMEKSGPNLDGIADKYTPEQLARQILFPSEFITHGFEQVQVVTVDGRLLAGRMERSNQIEIRLVDAQGKINNIKRTDIDELKEVPTSFMPEDLQKGLSKSEFVDLMAYLQTLKRAFHDGFAAGGKSFPIQPLSPAVKLDAIHPPELQFENPVWCGALPGTDSDLLVIEHMTRRIWRLIRNEAAVRKELFLEMSDKEVHAAANQGIMCLTFHPDFVKNRRYFLEYEVRENGEVKTTVVERKASEDGLRDAGVASRRLLEVFQPAGNHNGGCIDFGPDGMLYAAFGDGGPQKDPNGYAQNPREFLGSMLRIDVDHRDPNLPYAIPADNPFWEEHRRDAKVRAETWAIGLREPWRFSFDKATGELYVGDVGQNEFEEVCIVRRGENHGWNVREGFTSFSDQYARPAEKFADPLFAYPHGLGFSVTGGYVYHGLQNPSFAGVYIFGDYNTRLIWGLKQVDGKLQSVCALGEAPNGIASFGVDQQGEVYLVTYKGTIYHVNLSGTTYDSKSGAPSK